MIYSLESAFEFFQAAEKTFCIYRCIFSVIMRQIEFIPVFLLYLIFSKSLLGIVMNLISQIRSVVASLVKPFLNLGRDNVTDLLLTLGVAQIVFVVVIKRRELYHTFALLSRREILARRRRSLIPSGPWIGLLSRLMRVVLGILIIH